MKLTTLIIVILSISSPAFAGAWVPKQGSLNVIHDVTIERYPIFQDSEGKRTLVPEFFKYEYKPYIEYGLDGDFSLGISPSFQQITSAYFHAFDSGVDKNYALAYSEIFMKAKILQNSEDGYAISITPMVEIPGIYEETSTPFFGKKEQFWSLFVNAGKNTYNQLWNYGYIDLSVGYRERMEGTFSDNGGGAVIVGLQTAWPIFRDLQTNFGVTYTKTVSRYDPNNTISSRYGFDALKFNISQIATYGDTSIEYGYIAQPYARNTGLGMGMKLSISNRF